MNEHPPDDAQVVLAVVRDLMFLSRITATAKRAGVIVRAVRDPAKLSGLTGRLVIADLDLDGALEAAAEWSSVNGRPAAGFVQHVNVDRIRAAQAAGIKPVIPRSRFDAVLPGLLVLKEPRTQ